MKEEAMGVDVQEIVGQLVKSAAEDPDSLKQFGVDPAAAIKGATGLDLSEEGKELNLDAVMKAAGDFLGNDPSALLGKLGGLFDGK